MKKVTTLLFVLALAIGAGAQSINTPRVSDTATNSTTVSVPPVAKPAPVAVPHKKPNSR